jgi:hypothetical protein
MCHKKIFIFDLLRCPAWILASLSLFAPGARAWNCTTCDQYGTCDDGSSWIITQDVWGAASGWQQCLYSDSHSSWQVVADLEGQTWVGSYPHASYTVNAALNDVVSSPTPLLAAWNASFQHDDKFDFAYDLWLNDTTYEVMIWLDWNDTSPIGGSPFTNATIDGITYNVYEGAGGSGPYCISFLPQNRMLDTATNFNLCGVLGWISNLKWSGGPGGYFWQNPTFDSVQLGWEICDTYGSSETFAMNFFNVYFGNTVSTPPTPTAEKLIWQANFGTTFTDNGAYGFSDRDGSPAATGSLSTNLTGGVGGSASLEYTVDFSSWSNSPPVIYSGFGLGVSETPLPYMLTSSNAASYRVYLSAKVSGTSAGVTNVPGAVDVTFFIPNGTEVCDLTSSVAVSTNWESYVFTNLQIATWLTGAQQLFNQNVTNINKMELQLTVDGSPNLGTLFGYDKNNTVDIDNIKVVQLVPGLAPLTVVQTNGQTLVTWADPDPTVGGTAQLQSAMNVAGPYLGVAGASSAATASPYAVPPGNGQQFFRALWVP